MMVLKFGAKYGGEVSKPFLILKLLSCRCNKQNTRNWTKFDEGYKNNNDQTVEQNKEGQNEYITRILHLSPYGLTPFEFLQTSWHGPNYKLEGTTIY